MNKEETKKAIEVMQAYADGKQIQTRARGFPSWTDFRPEWEPEWNWVYNNYRVKPEPREWWEASVDPWNVRRFVSREDARKHCPWAPDSDIVKVREVLE